jgi:hypothetical protein
MDKRTTRSQIRAVDDAKSNPLSDAKSNSTREEGGRAGGSFMVDDQQSHALIDKRTVRDLI